MVREEVDSLTRRLDSLAERLKVLLLPRDPLDDRNIMLEIRAGTGGEEAALWAADLVRMYQMYATTQGWKVSMVSESAAEKGGYRECILQVRCRALRRTLKLKMLSFQRSQCPDTDARMPVLFILHVACTSTRTTTAV